MTVSVVSEHQRTRPKKSGVGRKVEVLFLLALALVALL